MAWSVGAGLEGEGVVVVGAAWGIGRDVVAAFATAGARVAAVDLDRAAAEAAIAGLPGGSHLAIGMDIRLLAEH